MTFPSEHDFVLFLFQLFILMALVITARGSDESVYPSAGPGATLSGQGSSSDVAFEALFIFLLVIANGVFAIRLASSSARC